MMEQIAVFIQKNPFLGVFLLSLFISTVLTLVTKFTTNQTRMKELKDKQKECQKRMKDHKDNPTKMMEIQKEMMQYSGEMFKHSFKPMLITFIPLILLLSWANSTIAFMPIAPQSEFIITAVFDKNTQGMASIEVPAEISVLNSNETQIQNSQASWKLKGAEGKYNIKIIQGSEEKSKEVIISSDYKYASVKQAYSEGAIKSISINNKKLVIIPILGGIGWLWSYILLSILLNAFILRKIFNVQ